MLIEDPLCTGDSEQLLCQLKSVCAKTVGDFSNTPVSVNVHFKRRSVQITTDVCSSITNEGNGLCRGQIISRGGTAQT